MPAVVQLSRSFVMFERERPYCSKMNDAYSVAVTLVKVTVSLQLDYWGELQLLFTLQPSRQVMYSG